MTENKGNLISREALKKAIEQGEGFSWDSYGKDDLCVRKKYIDNAPIVHHPNCDICEDKAKQYSLGFQDGYLTGKERPQGEWIIIKSPLSTETVVKCPFCHDEFIGNDVEHYNYCPNCGASMQKGETE